MFSRKSKPKYRPDIEAALAIYREVSSNIDRVEIVTLEGRLEDGEQVLFLSSHGSFAMTVLTDRRLLHIWDRKLVSIDRSYRLADITNAIWAGSLALIIGGTRISIGLIPPKHGPRLLAALNAAMAAAKESAADPDSGTEQLNVIAQLERLGALRNAGVVTEDEFQTKKTEMLARI
jgi:hypothetical protein